MLWRLLLMFAGRNQGANWASTNLGANLGNLVACSLLLLVFFLFDLHLNLSVKLFKDLLWVGSDDQRVIFLELVAVIGLVCTKLLGWWLPALSSKLISSLLPWQNWHFIVIFMSSWRRRMLYDSRLFLPIVDFLCVIHLCNGWVCIHILHLNYFILR